MIGLNPQGSPERPNFHFGMAPQPPDLIGHATPLMLFNSWADVVE